ncbi:MAG: SixA phosphatase family protein [Chitinophagaceae bacterium]
MSKQLLLVRHAKSSWSDFSIKDFDRPLNDRGKKDAPAMAKRLLDKRIAIDAFISSPAKRARKTAEYFAEEYDQSKKAIIFIDELYLATPEVFARVISQVSDEYDTIAVFSHNNGITDFANTLTDTRIDEMPTCSIFAVKASIQSWSEFKRSKKAFWFFDYPKATAS